MRGENSAGSGLAFFGVGGACGKPANFELRFLHELGSLHQRILFANKRNLLARIKHRFEKTQLFDIQHFRFDAHQLERFADHTKSGLGASLCFCRCFALQRLVGKAQSPKAMQAVVVTATSRCDRTPCVIFPASVTRALKTIHVDGPLITVFRREVVHGLEASKWQTEFDGPAFVAITTLVYCSSDLDLDEHTTVVTQAPPGSRTAVSREERVKDRALRVDLKLNVIFAIAVGVNEQLHRLLFEQRVIALAVLAANIAKIT